MNKLVRVKEMFDENERSLNVLFIKDGKKYLAMMDCYSTSNYHFFVDDDSFDHAFGTEYVYSAHIYLNGCDGNIDYYDVGDFFDGRIDKETSDEIFFKKIDEYFYADLDKEVSLEVDKAVKKLIDFGTDYLVDSGMFHRYEYDEITKYDNDYF